MTRSLTLAVLAAVVGPLAMADRATAEVGVGIGAAPIVVDGRTVPASGHDLGPVVVVNTGREPATLTLATTEETGAGGAHRPVPSGWVSFDPPSVRLGPGERTAVDLRLEVPAGAEAGDYGSLVVAGVAQRSPDGTSGLGAAAATRLTFAVGEPAPDQRRSALWWPTLAGTAALLVLILTQRIARSRRHRP